MSLTNNLARTLVAAASRVCARHSVSRLYNGVHQNEKPRVNCSTLPNRKKFDRAGRPLSFSLSRHLIQWGRHVNEFCRKRKLIRCGHTYSARIVQKKDYLKLNCGELISMHERAFDVSLTCFFIRSCGESHACAVRNEATIVC